MTRIGFLILLLVGVVLAVAWARIFRRIGWPPWLAVATVVPLVALVMPLIVAFSRWPVEERSKGPP
jgi:carbon starvation protein CstA